ncbi:MAG: hypothetical protein JO194_00110 [Candidatus Eremiobacteraeota bacterium]|nr:hypothetical protein [Candidatus Eremiobacteraeota bacterium]
MSLDDPARAQMLRELALELHHGGHADESRDAFERSLALLERAGDLPAAGAVCLEAGHLAFNTGDVTRAHVLFDRALAAANGVDDVLWFTAHVSLAGLHAFVDDAPHAREHIEQAERYRGPRPPAEDSRLHQFRALACVAAGDAHDAVRACEQAAAIASASGDPDGAVRALGNIAVNLAKLGARDETLQLFERARRLVGESGSHSVSAGFCLMQYAVTCHRFGLLECARELVAHACAMGIELRKFEIVAARIGIAIGLLLLDDELVERSAARDFFEIIEGLDESAVPYAACAYIDYSVARGRFDDARGIIDRTLNALEVLRGKQTENVVFVHIAVHGDPAHVARARTLLAGLDEAQLAREHDTRAYLTLFDARVALRENHASQARSLAARAAQQFSQLGWDYYEALAREVAGERDRALAIYRRIGDARDVRRMETARKRGRPRSAGPGGMSPRELEVGALIALGKSNRAISESLAIGERTVESHASSLLNKLGLASRAELIAYMARDGTPAI